MESIYTTYRCKRCKKETIVITAEEWQTLKEGHYINCSHCGSKHIVKEKTTDDPREVMIERSYKRINGALRQMERV